MSQKSSDSGSSVSSGSTNADVTTPLESPQTFPDIEMIDQPGTEKSTVNSKKRSGKSKSKPPEVPRVDPNCRERWRQQHVNAAFLRLRKILPSYPVDKKLSKQEILRRTIKYIRLLEGVLKFFEGQNSGPISSVTEESNGNQSEPCLATENADVAESVNSKVGYGTEPGDDGAHESVESESDEDVEMVSETDEESV